MWESAEELASRPSPGIGNRRSPQSQWPGEATQRFRYGPPEVVELREVETPKPTGDQVLVRVRAIGQPGQPRWAVPALRRTPVATYGIAARRRLLIAAAAAIWSSAGCALLTPVPTPSAEIEVRIPGLEVEGPITLVGEGQSGGMGWRYLMYEGPNSLSCTQLDTPESGGAGCDDVDEGSAFRLFTYGLDITQGDDQYEAVHGVLGLEVARVDAQQADGSLQSIELLQVNAAGVEGKAFVIIHLADARPRAIIAYGEDGSVLDTRNLDREFD